MITRRDVLSSAVPVLGGLALPGRLAAAVDHASFERQIAALEQASGGRLGVALIDPAEGTQLGHRVGERFPMCSTHKMISAAAILARVDRGQEKLDRIVRYGKAQMLSYSPATEKHVDTGMPIRDLCAAAVTLSDNTAANLLLAAIGGPAGWTAFVRTLGDKETRLDRNEPTLNECAPGDPRDTTMPLAIASDLRVLITGSALTPASRSLFTDWLVHNTTGDKRLRAGLPAGWKVGDKTGSGDRGTANDVAVIWPRPGAPVFVSAYLTGATVDSDHRDQTLAGVGKAVALVLR